MARFAIECDPRDGMFDMMRKSTLPRTLMAVLLMATRFDAAMAQSPGSHTPPAEATPSTFSIADVHVLANSKATHMNVAMVNHDRLLVHHATIVDLIAFAYGVDRDKVFGGPSWMDNDRYEIAALAPRDRDSLQIAHERRGNGTRCERSASLDHFHSFLPTTELHSGCSRDSVVNEV